MGTRSSLYENILIGNFLYGLGLSMGMRRPADPIPACISLLQQTPLDPLLGDALIEFPGTVRLFEFKRGGINPSMEFEKASFLRVALETDEELLRVSKRIHWFVQGLETGDFEEQALRVQPYLDLAAETKGAEIPLGAMVEALVDESLHISADLIAPELLARYLAAVACFHTGGATGGGLLVHIDPAGKLRYAPLNDMRDLALQKSQYIDKHLQLAPELSKGMSRSRGMER